MDDFYLADKHKADHLAREVNSHSRDEYEVAAAFNDFKDRPNNGHSDWEIWLATAAHHMGIDADYLNPTVPYVFIILLVTYVAFCLLLTLVHIVHQQRFDRYLRVLLKRHLGGELSEADHAVICDLREYTERCKDRASFRKILDILLRYHLWLATFHNRRTWAALSWFMALNLCYCFMVFLILCLVLVVLSLPAVPYPRHFHESDFVFMMILALLGATALVWILEAFARNIRMSDTFRQYTNSERYLNYMKLLLNLETVGNQPCQFQADHGCNNNYCPNDPCGRSTIDKAVGWMRQSLNPGKACRDSYRTKAGLPSRFQEGWKRDILPAMGGGTESQIHQGQYSTGQDECKIVRDLAPAVRSFVEDITHKIVDAGACGANRVDNNALLRQVECETVDFIRKMTKSGKIAITTGPCDTGRGNLGKGPYESRTYTGYGYSSDYYGNSLEDQRRPNHNINVNVNQNMGDEPSLTPIEHKLSDQVSAKAMRNGGDLASDSATELLLERTKARSGCLACLYNCDSQESLHSNNSEVKGKEDDPKVLYDIKELDESHVSTVMPIVNTDVTSFNVHNITYTSIQKLSDPKWISRLQTAAKEVKETNTKALARDVVQETYDAVYKQITERTKNYSALRNSDFKTDKLNAWKEFIMKEGAEIYDEIIPQVRGVLSKLLLDEILEMIEMEDKILRQSFAEQYISMLLIMSNINAQQQIQQELQRLLLQDVDLTQTPERSISSVSVFSDVIQTTVSNTRLTDNTEINEQPDTATSSHCAALKFANKNVCRVVTRETLKEGLRQMTESMSHINLKQFKTLHDEVGESLLKNGFSGESAYEDVEFMTSDLLSVFLKKGSHTIAKQLTHLMNEPSMENYVFTVNEQQKQNSKLHEGLSSNGDLIYAPSIIAELKELRREVMNVKEMRDSNTNNMSDEFPQEFQSFENNEQKDQSSRNINASAKLPNIKVSLTTKKPQQPPSKESYESKYPTESYQSQTSYADGQGPKPICLPLDECQQFQEKEAFFWLLRLRQAVCEESCKALPYPCVYFFHILMLILGIAAAMWALALGIQLSPVKSQEWLSAVSLCICLHIFVLEVIKVTIIAVYINWYLPNVT